MTTTQPEMLTSAPSTSNARLLVWPAVGCAPSGPTADPPASAILPRRRPFAWCSARNLDEPDSKCDLNHLRGNAVAKSVEIAMSNSFAFGGHNVSPVFGPHPQAADAGPGLRRGGLRWHPLIRVYRRETPSPSDRPARNRSRSNRLVANSY